MEEAHSSNPVTRSHYKWERGISGTLGTVDALPGQDTGGVIILSFFSFMLMCSISALIKLHVCVSVYVCVPFIQFGSVVLLYSLHVLFTLK